MKDSTRETMQTAGLAGLLTYALVPQVRKFVNDKTTQWFGSSDSTADTGTDTTTDGTTSDGTDNTGV